MDMALAQFVCKTFFRHTSQGLNILVITLVFAVDGHGLMLWLTLSVFITNVAYTLLETELEGSVLSFGDISDNPQIS